jgi:spore coat polysaccharide biosynthesis protein SpsF
MGSTRLPGKVLRPLGGRPVLNWVVEAARAASVSDRVVVATSVHARDAPIVDVAVDAGAAVHRGPEDDVLARFLGVADEWGADALVRLTADCPLLDPAVIRIAAGEFRMSGADLVTTGSPGDLPRGLDVEVVRVDALRIAAEHGTDDDHEHVTSYIAARPGEFSVRELEFGAHASDLRVTLDTEEDARLLDAVVGELGTRASCWTELVGLLRARPDLVRINAAVRQRAPGA